jgi:folate-binding protein YgfZ
LTRGAAVHDLGWQRRLAVRGQDRFRWLSGMVTNNVTDLQPNTGAWNLVLNAQGRILGELTVWRGDASGEAMQPGAGDLELEIAADQYQKLLAHLDHYIVMDDVELTQLNGEAPGEPGPETALGLTGPQADEVLTRVGLPVLGAPMTSTRVEWNAADLWIARTHGVLAPHYEIWVAESMIWKLWTCLRAAGAMPVGSVQLEAFRIAEGIPLYGVDIAERDLPQETNQLRALNFSKGCYQGQEIVERIRSRGSVHRHLRQLELDGSVPPRGTGLTIECAPAGEITSAAELALPEGSKIFALAMLRAEAEAKNQPLAYEGGTARMV